MAKDYSLYAALSKVQTDAEKRHKWHLQQLTQTPLRGWSREKHDLYHTENAREAKATAHYCFIRQMQISPD